jgi:uncharacterized iron-regulated membrane protein
MHEGQLFGWLNQLLNLLTALGLTLLAVSSAVLWWRRRPQGRLGAPVSRPADYSAVLAVVLTCFFGVLLPLFGISLIVVLVLERLVIRRSHGISAWLGLTPVAQASAPPT